jgi:putative transposase
MKPARQRTMVDHVGAEWQVSIRRACRALPVRRSTYHYCPRRAEQTELRKRIKEIAETRVLLSAHSRAVAAGGLGGESETGLPAISGDGPAIAEQNAEAAGKSEVAIRPRNGRRSERYLGDGLCTRPTLRRGEARALTIVDLLSRASPAIDVRQNYRGRDVVDTLERATGEFGYPKTIRVDNGPEFVSRELDLWAYMKGVTLDFSRPGKPTDNAFIESFSGKFRAECLNANWFMSLDEARAKCEAWRRDYNEVRPHSVIGNKTPMELHGMAASPASRSSHEARVF